MIHPLIDEWDAAYIQAVATPDETATLEKKGSELFDPVGKKAETREELAKQVCAFSNAGGGFLVYGVKKGGGLDVGVPELVGSQPVKAWVEAEIPKLVRPPVTGCQARHISVPGYHAAGQGVLLVEIPLSESRPHWIEVNNKQVPYIRVGEHSGPMHLQTFLDVSSRTSAAQGEIVSLNVIGRDFPRATHGGRILEINPIVRLVSGPFCEHWAFDLRLPGGRSHFLDLPDNTNFKGGVIATLAGHGPLFPGRNTRVGNKNIRFTLGADVADEAEFVATLCVGSAQPVTRRFRVSDLLKSPGSNR